MKTNEQQLNEFLQWFSQLDSVPITVRRDFFKHMDEIGGLDTKAIKFVNDTLKNITNTTEIQLNNLKQQWTITASALKIQAKPGFSFKEKIMHYATQLMLWRGENFNSNFKAVEQHDTQQQEDTEQQVEIDEVAALKASLGM